MNTISARMLRRIRVLPLEADRDLDVRCVVLTSEDVAAFTEKCQPEFRGR